MTAMLDTNAWAWTLVDPKRLSVQARAALRNANSVLICPISIYEIGQNVRLGKWSAMQPYVSKLPDMIAEQGGICAHMTPDSYLRAVTLDWPHRNPFDRIIAATALQHGAAIISTDTVFDSLPGLRRIW